MHRPESNVGDQGWLPLTLLLCAVSINLRSILLSVPPALPEIRSEFHLTFAAAGALTALPVVVMGAAAIPGAALVDRFGARHVLGLATAGLAVSSMLRLAPGHVFNLYAWTAAFAACIAVSHPALAVLARAWFPTNVQRATTVYSAALNAGAVAGATLSVYFILAVGWRGTFAIWSAFALFTAGAWFALAPTVPHVRGDVRRLRSALRDSLLWRVALILGAQSIIYYGASTWTPFQLRGADHGYVSFVLLILTGTAIPVGIFLASLKRQWASSRFLYVAAGALAVTGSLGFIVTPTSFAWLWALLLGMALGMGFSGGMSMPSLIAPTQAHVATYSALALTVAYTLAFIGPLVGGFLVDRTNSVAAPFWLTTASGIALALIGSTLPRDRSKRERVN